MPMAIGEIWEEEMKFGVRYRIICTPTGWIYQPIFRHATGKDEYLHSTFVPFTNT